MAKKKRADAIPPDQWRLPAGYHRQHGRVASFARVVDPRSPTVDGDELSDEQRAELTLERIRRQKKFRFGVLGDGVLDKERALEEVRRRSQIGAALIDVEHRAIRLMREYLAQHPDVARPATSVRKRAGAKRVKTTEKMPRRRTAKAAPSRPPASRRRTTRRKTRAGGSKKRRR